MTINELLFSGDDSIECCYDRPHAEIAWDQWTRTRIFCKHGVFEGVSDSMDLSQGIERAMTGFRASIETGIHHACWSECPVPQEWIGDGNWSAGDTTECELIRGHDGEHHCFPDDDAEEAFWADRRVYYLNGHDVTGKRPIPTPIGSRR